MMKTAITREQAYALLRKYNQDPSICATAGRWRR